MLKNSIWLAKMRFGRQNCNLEPRTKSKEARTERREARTEGKGDSHILDDGL